MTKGDNLPELRRVLGLEKDDILWKDFADNRAAKSELIYFDEKVSMLERMALKFYPIIQEVARRMTKHKETTVNDYAQKVDLEKLNPH